MKTTNLTNFDGYKFRQAKKSILGETPSFRGENWEMLKEVAASVAVNATIRMWTHIYYKLTHKLTCNK